MRQQLCRSQYAQTDSALCYIVLALCVIVYNVVAFLRPTQGTRHIQGHVPFGPERLDARSIAIFRGLVVTRARPRAGEGRAGVRRRHDSQNFRHSASV
eukprot:5926340-Pleurochrysis_carterae.AAC.2